VNVARNLARASRRHQAALSRLSPPPLMPDFSEEPAGCLDDEARLLAKIATVAAGQPLAGHGLPRADLSCTFSMEST
jgi:hypothetical protein